MDKSKSARNIILGLAVPLLLIVLLFAVLRTPKEETPKYSEILSYMDVENEAFKDVESYDFSLENGNLTIKFTEDSKREDIEYTVPNLDLFINDMIRKQDKL